jgi:hypothetical protein
MTGFHLPTRDDRIGCPPICPDLPTQQHRPWSELPTDLPRAAHGTRPAQPQPLGWAGGQVDGSGRATPHGPGGLGAAGRPDLSPLHALDRPASVLAS